jgi:hypothetical protein
LRHDFGYLNCINKAAIIGRWQGASQVHNARQSWFDWE